MKVGVYTTGASPFSTVALRLTRMSGAALPSGVRA